MQKFEYDLENLNLPDIGEFNYGRNQKYVSSVLQEAEERRKANTSEIFRNLMAVSPIVANIIDGLKSGETFKVVISDIAQAKIDAGEWHWANAKDYDGFFRGYVFDENGKIAEQCLIKKEEVMKGIDIPQMAMAMQGMAIQQQLQEISVKLDFLFDAVTDLKAGLQNDRLGYYYSAEYMYREALKVKDQSLRKTMITQALSNLSISLEQTKQTTLYEIGKVRSNYNPQTQLFKKSIKQEDINEIKKNFQFINKAVALKVAIYCNMCEYNSAVYSLLEYRDFLLRSLANKNDEALYYADIKEKSLAGFWNIQKNQYPNKIIKLCENIKNYNNYFIEFKEGKSA